MVKQLNLLIFIDRILVRLVDLTQFNASLGMRTFVLASMQLKTNTEECAVRLFVGHSNTSVRSKR